MLIVFVHLFTVQQNAGCYAIDQTRLSITADTLLAQNSNSMRLMHGLNGGIVASESGYPSDSTIFYDNDLNLGEVHTSMGASIATYTGIGTSSQQLNETLGVNGSFGQFGENPKVFNIPDLVNYCKDLLLFFVFISIVNFITGMKFNSFIF